MKYSETGFRAVYKRFCAFRITEPFRRALAQFPDSDKANYVLTYGYIDRTTGLTLEILAAGIETRRGFRFFEGNDKTTAKLRIGSVEEAEFAVIEDPDGSLQRRFRGKVKAADRDHAASAEVEKSRGFAFLDSCRDKYCIDEVRVLLTKKGLDQEFCRTRIIGLGDHFFKGALLNEPAQNFGYHAGEKIAFFARETEDGKIVCYTDLTPGRKLTAEDLADGTMLKEAIRLFKQERTEANFVEILEILRDSYIWIPCTAVLSGADISAITKAAEDALNKGDPDSLIGKSFTSQDDIRMIPDILQNGDRFYFPVFSEADEMGEYGKSFSKMEKHFTEALKLAAANEKEVSGIVVNAFSDPFILDREAFGIVEKMKSRLE